jgi:hypothetical protein
MMAFVRELQSLQKLSANTKTHTKLSMQELSQSNLCEKVLASVYFGERECARSSGVQRRVL